MTGNGSGALRQILEACGEGGWRSPSPTSPSCDKKVDPYRSTRRRGIGTAHGSPSRWSGSGSAGRSTCAACTTCWCRARA